MVKNSSSIKLAYYLLNKFSSLRNIFDADIEQICQTPRLNKNKFMLFKIAIEISHRCLEEQVINTSIIDNKETAILYLTSKLRSHKREVFACLFLNNQNKLIHYEELFYGTINNTYVYPREVAKAALKHNAASVIFAHNHPSGSSAPSPQDKHLTKTLTKILKPLDIRVLDHIIIGNNDHFSMLKPAKK